MKAWFESLALGMLAVVFVYVLLGAAGFWEPLT
jgi:hypothetical protein